MGYFRNLPIKRKLTAIILGITTAALLAACLAFVACDIYTFRESLAERMRVLADVLGVNSTAALQFKNESDAAEVLAALKAEPDILMACLYGADGKLFASYSLDDAQTKFPSAPAKESSRFYRNKMTMVRPVVLGDKRVGSIYLETSLNRMYARLATYAEISALVLVGSLLLALALSAAVQRFISKPILTLVGTARLVLEKKDYSVRAHKESEDELGLLTDSFNEMLGDIQARTDELQARGGELQARTTELQKANESLHGQAGQITDSVRVLGSATGDILKAATLLSSTATEIATAVRETTTTVGEVRQTSEVTSEKARLVSDSAQKAGEISQRGRHAAENAAAGIGRIRDQMALIAESMVRLTEQSQTIGEIVATVEDLAAQSNILAVNAAIEAAKAGEHGKGFAVVAQEVKNLADQSKQATRQVRNILNDIQKATAAAVMATEQGGKAVEAGVRQTGEAGESILRLAESVSQAAQSATQISASSQQQVVGMNQVATAMESINQASIQNVQSARDLEISARNLSDFGERLKQTVEQIGG